MAVYKEKTKTPSQNLLFICVLFLIYVRPYEVLRFLIPFQLTRICMVGAMIVFLSKNFNMAFQKTPLLRERSMKWYLTLQALTLASAVYSVWPSNTVSVFMGTNLRIIITFVVLSSLLYSRAQVMLFVKTIFICLFCFSLRIFLAFKSGSFIWDGAVKRIVGVGTLGSSDPNDVALVLAMGVPIGLYYVFLKKGGKRIVYLGMLISLVIAVVTTGSRGGLIGLGTGVCVFFAALYRKQKPKLIGMVILMAILAVVFLPSEVKGRFMSSFDKSTYTHTDEKYGRVAIWKRSFKELLGRPIGFGGGNSVLAEGAGKQDEGVVGKWMHTHNSYLQMGLEIGFAGLFVYLMFLFSGFINLKESLIYAAKTRNREYELLSCGFFGGLAAFMTSGFFLSQAYNWNPYIYVAMTMGIKRSLDIKYAKKKN